MKNSITSQATGGKKHDNPGKGFKVAHNYQRYFNIHKPSKYAKAKQKSVK